MTGPRSCQVKWPVPGHSFSNWSGNLPRGPTSLTGSQNDFNGSRENLLKISPAKCRCCFGRNISSVAIKIFSQMALWEESCAGSAGVCEGSRMAQPQHKWFVFLAVLAKQFNFWIPLRGKKRTKYISFFIIRCLQKSQEEESKQGTQVHFSFCGDTGLSEHTGGRCSALLVFLCSVSALHQGWIWKSVTAPHTSDVWGDALHCFWRAEKSQLLCPV